MSEAVSKKPARPTPLSAGGWALFSFGLTYVGAGLLYIPLARLLERSDFGLFGVATLVSSALSLMVELTLIRSLVRMPGDRNQLAQATLKLAVWFGLGGALVCALSGPLMAQIYAQNLSNAALLNLTQPTLAIGVFAVALGAVPNALLWRGLNFKRKMIPETVSVAIAATVALIAAWFKAGVFALVLYQVLRAVIGAAIAWLVAGWRPSRAYVAKDTWRQILGFSLPTSGGEFALYARFNVDYAIASLRITSADALGLYLLAYNTADRPALMINAFFGGVGYATFSRLQGYRERLQRIFLSATRILACVALPIYVGAILVRQELAVAVFGAKGVGMPEVILPFFIFQALWVIFYPSAAITLATGHNRLYATVNMSSLVVTVIALFIGVNFGIEGVAWAVLIVAGTTQLVWFWLACRFVQPSWGQIWAVFRLPLVFTLVTGSAIIATLLIFNSLGISNLNFPSAETKQSVGDILKSDSFIRLAVGSVVLLVSFGLVAWRNWAMLRNDLAILREQLPEESEMLNPNGVQELADVLK